MIKLLGPLLFGVVVLLNNQIHAQDSPYATFTVAPSQFSVGTNYTARCTIGGFDASSVFSYAATYYLNATDASVNPEQRDEELGEWLSNNGLAPQFTTVSGIPEHYGLAMSAGDLGTLPNFEVKFTPNSDLASGSYLCSVVIYHDLGHEPIEVKSSPWDGTGSSPGSAFATLPSFELLSFAILLASSLKFALI